MANIKSVQESVRRSRLRRVLIENGLEPGSGLHSWRCEHPDVYGPCSCLDELMDELEAVVDD